jgi:hypothetical protein
MSVTMAVKSCSSVDSNCPIMLVRKNKDAHMLINKSKVDGRQTKIINSERK